MGRNLNPAYLMGHPIYVYLYTVIYNEKKTINCKIAYEF